MTEADLMRKEGQLFTKKQYKKCLSLIIILSVFSGLVTFAGIIIAIATRNESIVITGLIIGIIGFVLLIISTIVAFKYAAKIQLYRHYKKCPEDFEKEIE